MKLEALDLLFSFAPSLKKCNKRLGTRLSEIQVMVLVCLLMCTVEKGHVGFQEILYNLKNAKHPISKDGLHKKLKWFISNGYIKRIKGEYSLSAIGSNFLSELEKDLHESNELLNNLLP